MPEIDGWSVLSELKADSELSNIPVAIISMIESKQTGFSLGAAEYLMKPVDRNQLIKVLEKYQPKINPQVLLIEDEQATRNLFARRRISYQCRAAEVSQQSETGLQVLAGLQARFGNIVELLMTLKDVHLIRLEIDQGTYVAGFGKAFAIHADGSLEQVSRM